MTATAGVVLAGGRSTRMGTDKADLPWGAGTLLEHVLDVLGAALGGPLVVVGAADRPRSAPAPARVVHDPVPGGGPLRGIATGLEAAAEDGAATAFVCSVDLPLLHPAYVAAVVTHLVDDTEVALPVLGGHHQPLAAGYVTALGARASTLMAEGARRPGELFAASRVRRLDAETLLADPALRAVDPELHAVRGANTPEELRALRERATVVPPGMPRRSRREPDA